MDEVELNMQKDEKYLQNKGNRPYRYSLTHLIEAYQNVPSIFEKSSKAMFHCGELKGVMRNCDELLLKHFCLKELFDCYGVPYSELFDLEKENERIELINQLNQEIESEASIRNLWKIAMSDEILTFKDENSLNQRINRQWEKIWDVCHNREGSFLDLALILYVNYWLYPKAKEHPELFSKFIHYYLREHQWIAQPLLVSQFIVMEEWKPYFKERDDEEQLLGWIHYFIEKMNEICEFQLDYVEKIQLRLAFDYKIIDQYKLGINGKQNMIKAFIYFIRIPTSDTSSLSKSLGVSYNTAATILCQLEELGIISRANYNQRNKNFYYRNYVENGLFEV